MCREHAQHNGWIVSEEHIYADEYISGGSDERPAFHNMMSDIEIPMKAHLVTTLLCLMFIVGTFCGMRETVSKLVIADKGVSHCSIVVSDAASPSENHAAKELEYFLKGMSGANLPIVTEKEAMKSHDDNPGG